MTESFRPPATPGVKKYGAALLQRRFSDYTTLSDRTFKAVQTGAVVTFFDAHVMYTLTLENAIRGSQDVSVVFSNDGQSVDVTPVPRPRGGTMLA